MPTIANNCIIFYFLYSCIYLHIDLNLHIDIWEDSMVKGGKIIQIWNILIYEISNSIMIEFGKHINL